MSCCTLKPRSWRGLSGFNSRSSLAARLARDLVRNTTKNHRKYCAPPRRQFKRNDLAIRETEYVARANSRGTQSTNLHPAEFGVGFTAGGFFFFVFGIFAFFDAAFLALGNILFVIGLVLIIGPQRTIAFFSRPNKLRGTFCFCLGIVLILLKWSFIGFVVESFGILGLFGDFFGTIVQFLRSIPYIGDALSHPAVAPAIDRLAGISGTLPV